jgi:hypothetical protein
MRLVGSVHNARKSLGNGLVERGGGRQARSKTPGCMCPSYTTLGEANGPFEPTSLHAHVLASGMPSAVRFDHGDNRPFNACRGQRVPDEALVVPWAAGRPRQCPGAFVARLVAPRRACSRGHTGLRAVGESGSVIPIAARRQPSRADPDRGLHGGGGRHRRCCGGGNRSHGRPSTACTRVP